MLPVLNCCDYLNSSFSAKKSYPSLGKLESKIFKIPGGRHFWGFILNQNAPCFKCGFSGWVIGLSEKDSCFYAFKCGCFYSSKLAQSLPTWSDSLSQKYKVDFATQKFTPKVVNKNFKIEHDLEDECPF